MATKMRRVVGLVNWEERLRDLVLFGLSPQENEIEQGLQLHYNYFKEFTRKMEPNSSSRGS